MDCKGEEKYIYEDDREIEGDKGRFCKKDWADGRIDRNRNIEREREDRERGRRERD